MGFYLSLWKEAIDHELDQLISNLKTPLKPILKDALHGGQRLRPLLMLALVHDFKIVKGEILRYAQDDGRQDDRRNEYLLSLPIELVHNAALILDDLPCMDNAKTRRDQQPLHKKYGQAQAILSAFALVGLSMELITKLPLSSELKEKCVSLLASALGPERMSAGQCLDLSAETQKLTFSDVEGIYYQKTGILFEAAILFACYYQQADLKLTEKLSQWGRRFGFLYQLRDDDIDQKEETIGINVHRLFEKKRIEEIRTQEKNWLTAFIQDEKNSSRAHFPSLSDFITLL